MADGRGAGVGSGMAPGTDARVGATTGAGAGIGAGTDTTTFDRDTRVELRSRADDDGRGAGRATFALDVSGDWRAGRGPHGGYLAAILLRALEQTVADPLRAPRSLTIHYARAPSPGAASIVTTVERAGRSLSTLSARMEQDGALVALALAAFSVPWSTPDVPELPLPDVAPPDASREVGVPFRGAPQFTRHLVLQPRIGVIPFQGSSEPMEIGAWLGLSEPRAIDALSLAFFSDALFSPPFIRASEPASSPTIDLTIHFRATLAAGAGAMPDKNAGAAPPARADGATSTSPAIHSDPHELCFARFRTGVVQEGFFEEDGVIWAADGTVLAQSRQLAIVMPIG